MNEICVQYRRDQLNCRALSFFFFNLAVEKNIRYIRIYTVFEESSLKLCTVKVSDQNWYISAWLLYHVLLRRKSMFNAA